jgi:hypothetical protein
MNKQEMEARIAELVTLVRVRGEALNHWISSSDAWEKRVAELEAQLTFTQQRLASCQGATQLLFDRLNEIHAGAEVEDEAVA